MEKNKTVTINGQRYDAQTGMRIAPTRTTDSPIKKVSSSSVHAATQKSRTLIRRVAKKPVKPSARPTKTAGRTMDIARSSKITRFAPRTVQPQAKTTKESPDLPPANHPIVSRALSNHKPVAAPPAQKSAKEIKEQAITEALAKPTVKHRKKSFLKRHPRALSILSLSVAIALIGAYLTYVNMPNLSVRIASSRAGIEAQYPDYRPDGYKLDGPVTFSDGEVTINFKANTGSNKFTLKQTKSSWDSSAVLDNIVRKKAGEQYLTSQENGITIFSYNGNAAWVNGGILYTIEGNAPLSSDQIRRIATSL